MAPESISSEDRHPQSGSHSARRINTLARGLGGTRYLEIGVNRGKTFLAVDMPSKTAVDPRFQFDRFSEQTDSVQFHELTSDEWFLNCSRGNRFDIIFLDGLHTFEQTFRDFCNSLLLSHDNTVWVIDDTVPRDIYSSCPNQKLAGRVRRKDIGAAVSNKKPGGWNGDVFKLVFAIHDFFPILSYRTILAPGKPQTIVWRRPQSRFVPLFNNLEAISRLNYFDFQDNLHVLNGGTEEEVLQAALADLCADADR